MGSGSSFGLGWGQDLDQPADGWVGTLGLALLYKWGGAGGPHWQVAVGNLWAQE